MSPRRFRPRLQALETRETPTVGVLGDGTDLLVTGAPNTGTGETLNVRHVGDNNFRVTDGSADLGTYRVTRDLRLRLGASTPPPPSTSPGRPSAGTC